MFHGLFIVRFLTVCYFRKKRDYMANLSAFITLIALVVFSAYAPLQKSIKEYKETAIFYSPFSYSPEDEDNEITANASNNHIAGEFHKDPFLVIHQAFRLISPRLNPHLSIANKRINTVNNSTNRESKKKSPAFDTNVENEAFGIIANILHRTHTNIFIYPKKRLFHIHPP